MSTAVRLISGSAATWAQIAVTMASQVILVPIYLSHWDVKTYGTWLAVQGIMSTLSMIDLGHQYFIGYEFLRLGSKNLLDLSKYLWSAIVVGLILGTLQVLLIVVFFFSGILLFLLGESNNEDIHLLNSAGIALLLEGINWLGIRTISGLMSKALAPFGYAPRMMWWMFVYVVVAALAPLIAVIMGADLMTTSIALSVASFAYAVPFYIDIFRLLKREKIKLLKPSLPLGYSNFKKSLPLLGKSIFENMRQQGVRLVLAPLAGPIGLAIFSTMRTVANVALQGLNTILNPLIPDLTRFLHDRDQPRSEAAFATIWIVVVALMAPGIVILQSFIEPFFIFWTQGKIPFDPLLFAILSMGVVVYAVVQPAMAVVMGNNLTKTQLALSATAAVIVFGGLCLLVPIIGILGAAIALFLAEVVAAIGYIIYAERWLIKNQLVWPKRSFNLASASVWIAGGALAGMIWIPQFKWTVFTISMVLFAWNVWRYWQVLPAVAINSAKNILNKIPGINTFFKNYGL